MCLLVRILSGEEHGYISGEVYLLMGTCIVLVPLKVSSC